MRQIKKLPCCHLPYSLIHSFPIHSPSKDPKTQSVLRGCLDRPDYLRPVSICAAAHSSRAIVRSNPDPFVYFAATDL